MKRILEVTKYFKYPLKKSVQIVNYRYTYIYMYIKYILDKLNFKSDI